MDDDAQITALIGKPEDPEFHARPHYANVVGASQTPWDIKLTFSLLDPPTNPSVDEHGTFVIRPKIVSEVMVPSKVAREMIDLLRRALEAQAVQFGSSDVDNGGQ